MLFEICPSALPPALLSIPSKLFRISGWFALVLFIAAGAVAKANPTASVAQLSAAVSGSPVSTVDLGTVVTLTASVSAGSAPVQRGQVDFCDASSTYCSDIYRLGSAQLTTSGTATLKFRPGIGSHRYRAVFLGNAATSASTSNVVTLSVTGTIPSTTNVTASGAPGNYTVTAQVAASVNPGQSLSPSGIVSFVDTTNGNIALGTAALGQQQLSLNWSNSQSPAAGVEPSSVAVGDFNGDGIPDLAVANAALLASDPNNSPNGTISIFLGKGDGTFLEAANSPITVGQYTVFVTASDVNGDGNLDLIVANLYSQDIDILLGAGDGTFTQAAGSPFKAGFNVDPYSVAIADFNHDGIPDLAVAGMSGMVGTGYGLNIFLGNGDGTFQAPTLASTTPNYTFLTSVAVGDFNGDGIPDLVVPRIEDNQVTILLGNGDGTFYEAPFSPMTCGNGPVAVVVGDFNQDGVQDLAILDDGGGNVRIFLGLGNGSFNEASGSPITGADFSADWNLAEGDFNADGKTDLAVADIDGAVTILLGHGDGTFERSTISPAAGSATQWVATGDLDGDGVSDLVTANYGSNNATVLLTRNMETLGGSASGISPVGTGNHQVVAKFPANGDYAASTSSAIQLAATKGAPSITVAPAVSSLLTTDSLQVSVSVTGGPANPPPTGSVSLSSGAYISTPANLVSGSATFTIPGASLSAGTDTITAAYSPDSAGSTIFTATSASSSPIVVIKATPSVTVTPAGSSITTIQTLAVTVRVSGTPTPSGVVTLSSGTYLSSSSALSAGSATIAIPAAALAAGSDVIKATYTPDASSSAIYAPATATSTAVTVNKVAPTVTATPSATLITNTQSITVAVAVAVQGQSTPTGTVTLSTGNHSDQVSLASGSGSFTVPAGTLADGANSLTLTYNGDAIYSGATGSASVTVSPVVASSTQPSSTSPGGTATSTITLSAGSKYSGTMNLTCTLTTSPAGAQSLPNCSLNPATLTVPASGSVTSTLSVTTSAAVYASLHKPGRGTAQDLRGGLALATLLLLIVPRRKSWGRSLILIVGLLAAGVVACGGGGSSGSKPPVLQTPATTSGTYVFTVKAADAGNATISASTNITTVVQ